MILSRCVYTRKEITELLYYYYYYYIAVKSFITVSSNSSIIIQSVSRQYNVFDYSSCSLRAVVDSVAKKILKKARKNSALEYTMHARTSHRSRSR